MLKDGTRGIHIGQEYQLIARPMDAEGEWQYELLSYNPEDTKNGFISESNGKYRKIVSLDDFESAYVISIWCKYKGQDFQVSSYSEEDDYYEIYGTTPELEKELGFRFELRGEYCKTLKLGDLDSLYEVKSPILGFELPEEKKGIEN